MSYFCELLGKKRISCVKHGMSVQRPRARFLRTTTGIRELRKVEAYELVRKRKARVKATGGENSEERAVILSACAESLKQGVEGCMLRLCHCRGRFSRRLGTGWLVVFGKFMTSLRLNLCISYT